MTQQEFKKILDRAFRYGSDYWYEADSESYRLNIKSEETRRKYEEFAETSYKQLVESKSISDHELWKNDWDKGKSVLTGTIWGDSLDE